MSVLVTGAGTGLGLETALYLAEKGLTVYATVLSDEQRGHIEEQARQRHVALRVLPLDVTAQDSIDGVVQTMLDDCRHISAVVNNAGLGLRGYFEDLEEDEIRRTFEVNLYGVMAVTRAVLPHMRRLRRGRLVFISSIAGRMGAMARTGYAASKFAVEGFAESLMQEVTPLGLKVSIIEPAIINTERWSVNRGTARQALNPDSPYYAWFQQFEHVSEQLLRTSPTSPADVARAVYQALTVPQPRLRYVVGSRARMVVTLRRHIPGELFERLYFGEAMRRVTGHRSPLLGTWPW
jgi:NAD(P)-dependent dehydrogenase (short-subunit alcohol dehydrogenase family)